MRKSWLSREQGKRTEISWWFPGGVRLVYMGLPKTRFEWIRLTWKAYLAGWKLLFRVAWLSKGSK
jgi:hypothetical protein